MEFTYPDGLIKITTTYWQKLVSSYLQDEGKRPPVFPSKNDLRYILDVLYHTSFLTEESERARVNILYISPSDISQENNWMNNHPNPIKFNSPISFNIRNVLKLSPAINIRESAIVIGATKEFQTQSVSKEISDLSIWGILNYGDEYWKLQNGRLSAAFSPPLHLTIAIDSPGGLTVSAGGHEFFKLRNGKIFHSSINDISEGKIGDFFSDCANDLYSEVCERLKIKHYDTEDSDFDLHPKQVYFRTIKNILRITKNQLRGGTFIFVPNEIKADDIRLTDRVSLKYTIEKKTIWEALVAESESNKKFFEKAFKGKITLKELKENNLWENIRKRSEEEIFNHESFISQLSAIDGCVVLNKRLEVLGFGGEITARSPSLKQLNKCLDPEGEKTEFINIDSFGTRHRSAFRFCSSFEDSVALIVSHDGEVRAVKRNGPNLLFWDEIDLNE